jgi:hypothetical protein
VVLQEICFRCHFCHAAIIHELYFPLLKPVASIIYFPVRDTYWCNPRRVFHLLQHFPFACIARPVERHQTKLLFVSENRTGWQTVAEK